jgi:uncharacterized protein
MKDAALVSVVFDCNVILQAAAREKSIAAECLRLVEKGAVRLYLSKEILTEIKDVLNRPEIRNHFQNLSDEIVEAFLLRLQNYSQMVHPVPKKFIYSRDPDDESYINAAVESGADFIVSRDKDLLDLMNDYTIEAKEFRQRFRPLQVIEPIELLREIQKLESGVR